MRRFLSFGGLFILGISLTAGFFLWLNGLTPMVENGTSLPAAVKEAPHRIQNMLYEDALQAYTLTLGSEALKGEKLSLCVVSTRPFILYQNGTEIYRYAREDRFLRNHIVSLDPDEALHFHIRIPKVEKPGFFQVFSGTATWKPGVLIGRSSAIEQNASLFLSVILILMGLCCMIFVQCIILFRKLQRETYLALIALTCFASILMSVTVFTDFIEISYWQYTHLRIVLQTLPVVLNLYICIYLLHTETLKSRPILAVMWFVATGTLAVFFLRLFLGIDLFISFRRLLYIPMLFIFSLSSVQKKKEARLLFWVYTFTEGFVLSGNLVNTVFQTGSLFANIRVTEIGSLLFCLMCIFIIDDRLADKFLEAKKLNEELEQKVLLRTRELREQQEQKHNMMTNVFHDLRSPIFVVSGRLEQMRPSGAEEEESIQVMKTRLSYLERLTEDLFLTAKLESKEVLFDMGTVDLGQLLQLLIRDTQSLAENRSIQLSYSSLAHCFVWGDAFRLQQALQNLLDNALTYTPEGGSIRVLLETRDGNCAIAIRDSGPGIEEKDLPHVFLRYYRSDKHSKRSSGLGLSIAKEIITAHHGSIFVESEMGKGSCFTVLLPILDTSK